MQNQITVNLTEAAKQLLIVKLVIHRVYGVVHRRDLNDKYEALEKTGEDTIETSLRYIPKSWQTTLRKTYNPIKRHWQSNTLPYEDGGWRVVKAAKYEELMQRARQLEAAHRQTTNSMVAQHAEIKATAKKRLGKLWIESEFPSAQQLEQQLAVEFFVKPISRTNDTRLPGLSGATASSIQSSMNEQLKQNVTMALNCIVGQLQQLVEDALERYGRKDQDKVKYGSLQRRVIETCAAMRRLNFLDDKTLGGLIDKVEQSLTGKSSETLRGGGQVIKDAKAAAETALKEIKVKRVFRFEV